MKENEVYHDSDVALKDKSRVDDYFIDHLLGYGNASLVYVAKECGSDNHFVVLKEFFPHAYATRSEDKKTVNLKMDSIKEISLLQQAFQREYDMLRRVNENCDKLPVAPLNLDYFFANQTYYYVMEYVEGISMKEKMENDKGKKFVEQRFLNYMRLILQALDVIHNLGIVHCDLKPDNIILKEDGTLRIIDYGCACDKGEKTPFSWVSEGYSAPELYNNGYKEPATDYYSLGAILYELVTNNRPFSASMREDGDCMLGMDVPVKKEIREMINGLLEYNPQKRNLAMEKLKKEYLSRFTIRRWI